MAVAAGGRLQPSGVRGPFVNADVAARRGRIGGAIDGQRRLHVMVQRAVLMAVQITVRAVGRGRLDRRDWRDARITTATTVAGRIWIDRTGRFDLAASRAGGARVAGIKNRRRGRNAALIRRRRWRFGLSLWRTTVYCRGRRVQVAGRRQYRIGRKYVGAGMNATGVIGRVQAPGMHRQATVAPPGARMRASRAGVHVAGGALHAGQRAAITAGRGINARIRLQGQIRAGIWTAGQNVAVAMRLFVGIRHFGGTGRWRGHRVHVSLMMHLMVLVMLLRPAVMMVTVAVIVIVIRTVAQ